ncbi:MAG: hypothetical protein ABJD07_10265 [Gemmatimonadaceae bacterium]
MSDVRCQPTVERFWRAVGLLAGFALAGAPRIALAQGGRSAGVVLELPASARALALGNVYAAAGADESSVFYDPAQLAAVKTLAAGVSVQPYLASTTLGAVAVAVPLRSRGLAWTVGIGVQALDYGSAPELVADAGTGAGVPTGGRVSASDYVGSIGVGVGASPWRVGAAARYVSQRIAGDAGGTAALDIGMAVDVGRGATIAAVVQNLGGSLTTGGVTSSLPRNARVAGATPLLTRGDVAVDATAELVLPRHGNALGAGGAEVRWRATGALELAGRVGVLARPAGSIAAPVTFGGGVRASHFAVDYAYQKFDAFGGTHRLGGRWWR